MNFKSPEWVGMSFSVEELKDFEKQFLLDSIADPTYRYGQAFCNTFTGRSFDERIQIVMKYQDYDRLWNTQNPAAAKKIIQRYVDQWSITLDLNSI